MRQKAYFLWLISFWRTSIFLPGLASLFFVGVFIFQMVRLIESEDWLDHTDQAISKTVLLQRLMIDSETGIRGFLLSEDEKALRPYRSAQPLILSAFSEIKTFVADNPGQTQKMDSTARFFAEWSQVAGELVARGLPSRSAKHFFGVGRGSALMDLCRQETNAFLDEEQRLRKARESRLKIQVPRAIASGAAISLMLRLLITLLWRRVRNPKPAHLD